MTTTTLRPATDQEKQVLAYLNDLRDSGETNMFGAAPYIQAEFGIEKREARELLKLWMDNFNQEGNYDQVK